MFPLLLLLLVSLIGCSLGEVVLDTLRPPPPRPENIVPKVILRL